MDWLDFIWKFSGELLTLGLAGAVIFCNLYFFGSSNHHTYADNSYAAVFLNNHAQWNRKLYNKNNSIITTVANNPSLISEARADDFMSLTTDSSAADNPDDTSYLINQDGIVKPNPDSIQSLIQKQIKIYQTQDGDTLKSVADKNGLSIQTIKWANKLQTDQIKPGWQLIILPVDGVLYQADSNTTLPDMAKKFSADMGKIMSYNLMENEEDINPGQFYIIPDGTVPPAPPPPKPKAKPKKGQIMPPANIDYGNGHTFPWGFCTYYVATRVYVPWGGNAKQWLGNAKAYGAVISQKPSVGTIVVTTDNRRYGHVAIVEQVEGDRFLVSEMNYKGRGVIDQRWINIGSRTVKGFIHP